MRLRFMPVMMTLALVCLAGCGDNESGKKAANPGESSEETSAAPAAPTGPVVGVGGSRPQIGFIVRTDALADWKGIHAGAEKAVQEGKKGADGKPVIEVVWISQAPGVQVDEAKELLGKGVAAIVIAPEDQGVLEEVVKAAGRVPVVEVGTNFQAAGVRSWIASGLGADEAAAVDKVKEKGTGEVGSIGLAKAEVEGLQGGKVDYVVAADPMEVGALAVKTASECIREKKVEKRIDVPWHVVTKENIDAAENAALVKPAVEKYLKD